MDECCKPQFRGECCCNCRHNLQDFYDCTTTKQHEGCVCNQPKGYVCALRLNEGIVYSGWTEHGMCEMWKRQERVIRFKNGTSIKFSGNSEDKWVGSDTSYIEVLD